MISERTTAVDNGSGNGTGRKSFRTDYVSPIRGLPVTGGEFGWQGETYVKTVYVAGEHPGGEKIISGMTGKPETAFRFVVGRMYQSRPPAK